MSRPSHAVVVLVLAFSAVSVAGAVGQDTAATTTPVVGPPAGGPNYLAINGSDVAAHNTTTVDLDVGTAIAADSAALDANYTTSQFERTLESATDDANRSQIRDATLTRLENATDRLRERNRDAIQAFGNGDLSAAGFLRERARITLRANELQGVAATIENSLPYQPPEDVVDRVNTVQGKLEGMQGPISEMTARRIVRGSGGPDIYVEVSDSGYTLANVSDGTYGRETFLGDASRPEAEDNFAAGTDDPLDPASNRARELYPWVVENKIAGGGMFGGSGVYRTGWSLPGGKLTVYLDGGTTDVFRESQVRALPSFNTTTTIDRTNESLQLTVNRTFASGPAKITLRDVPSGEPVNGTVTIDNGEPIALGEDGTRWIVEPRGDVTVNATAGTTRFSATL